MRLVFTIKTMHFALGGAERVLATLCNGLSARGHEVSLISFDPESVSPAYELAPEIDWIRLGIGEPWAPSKLGEIRRRISGLRSVLDQKRPEMAVGFMHSACIPLSIAALGTGVPLVFSEHSTPQFYRDRRWEFFVYRLCIRRASLVTVISESHIPVYPRDMARRMRAVGNPVEVLSPKKASVVGEEGASKVLLSVGRLVKEKDHATLLRAFAAVAPDYPEWSLRIVGSGPMKRDLQNLAHSIGINDRVHWVGTVQDITAEYHRAQIFCIPSHYESMGLAAAEALSLGLPAVGFADCPGVSGLIIDQVNGILVPGADRVRNLSEALGQLMADTSLRVRLAAEGPKITERFSTDQFISRWEALIGDLRPHTAKAGTTQCQDGAS